MKEIFPDHVDLTIEDQSSEVSLKNDLVYIFAGGELPTEFLKNAGVEVEKTFGKIVKSPKDV